MRVSTWAIAGLRGGPLAQLQTGRVHALPAAIQSWSKPAAFL